MLVFIGEGNLSKVWAVLLCYGVHTNIHDRFDNFNALHLFVDLFMLVNNHH